MKKLTTLLGLIIGLLFGCQNKVIQKPESELMQNRPNIYGFKVKDLSENDFDFATLKGKKVIIVNTASKCGLTPQYKDLQALYDKYKDQNLIIIDSHANDLMSHYTRTYYELATFCKMNDGVTIPVMGNISVNGDNIAPIYKFLTPESQNGFADSQVEWNFQKYLINENGQLEKVVGPRISPTDKEIINWIEE